MHVEQLLWTQSGGWNPKDLKQSKPDLILYFGSRQSLASGAPFNQLKAMSPAALIVGCTTGGHMLDHDIVDDEVTGVAVRFTSVRLISE